MCGEARHQHTMLARYRSPGKIAILLGVSGYDLYCYYIIINCFFFSLCFLTLEVYYIVTWRLRCPLAVCQYWLLSVIFCRFYLASDSEPVLYIYVRLCRTHIQQARFRSPGKKLPPYRCEWIQFLK